MSSFRSILQRAEQRKGGADALRQLLPPAPDESQLVSRPDSFFLAEMTRSIFRSGFVWRVIENKWPGFLDAFAGFEPARLMKFSDTQWEDLLTDTRIVRHRQKIQAVRHNLWFIHDIAIEYGSFGQFLAAWPNSDLVGLFRLLQKKGSRLGGNTGQYFLQQVGKDSFALTGDVVQCLLMHGLDIRDKPTSHRDWAKIQQCFNDWHQETGLSYLQLSMVAAYSVGENRVKPGAAAEPSHRST